MLVFWGPIAGPLFTFTNRNVFNFKSRCHLFFLIMKFKMCVKAKVDSENYKQRIGTVE